jgi:hypothetical protein
MMSKMLFPWSGGFSRALFLKMNVVTLLAAFAAAGLLAPPAQAVPYASNLTNNAGTVSFRLNESADSVKIISGGGATTNDLGALSGGLHTFALGISGTFRVSVSKASAAGFTSAIAPNRGAILQISTDNSLVRFSQPRGLTVNTDPASPYFGRVYVANGASGAITNLNFTGTRTCGDGIYMLNADLSDALGLGDTASSGGLDFTTGGSVVPYRLSIGADGNLYVCNWADADGSLYVTDGNVSGGGANVLGGPFGGPFPVTATRYHGSIAAAIVEGSLGGGNLVAYVIDEDLQPDRASATQNARNTLWRHDIGSSLPGPATLPTRISTTTPWITFASQTMDVSRGTNGYFYVNDYRSTGNDKAGVYVLNSSGTPLWDSLATTVAMGLGPNDLLRATGGGAVSPDQSRIAVINLESNGITVLPLIGGIPDLTNRLVFHGLTWSGPQGREVAFDIAGNLYAISQGAQLMRVFSPGGATTAVTGSDGTFELVRPPGVSVEVFDSYAREETGAPDTATFSIYRTGDTSQDLTVQYTLTGTATNGTDYVTNVLSATILAGSTNVEVVITPSDDAVAEPVESVVLTLLSGAAYDLKSPSAGTAYIADNELPVLSIVSTRPSVEESFVQYGPEFVITRIGDTNADIYVNLDLTADSVAAESSDVNFFNHSILMSGGTVRLTNSLQLLPDQIVEGDELLGMFIAPSFEYTNAPGLPTNAYTIIRDDDYPTECVLFSDDFSADSSANWVQLFGANNGILDRTVTFDYSARGILSAPHSTGGGTLGLFLQVNKNEGSTAIGGGSAGVNLYPLMQSFGGNYALRFDLYLSMGSAGTTEHALAGLNHSGTLTNRVTQSTNAVTTSGGDGVFVAIETDGSNNRDWTAYSYPTPTSQPTAITNRLSSTLTNELSAPPYAFAGSPGNSTVQPYNYHAWSCVELGQSNGVISLRVNRRLIYSFTNTSGFNSGNIMIGMNDQFDSVGSTDNYAIIDNVRVVNLNPTPIITSINIVGGNIQIDFNAPCSAIGDLHLQSTTSLTPPIVWQDDEIALLDANGAGFRFTAFPDGATRYYRIRR